MPNRVQYMPTRIVYIYVAQFPESNHRNTAPTKITITPTTILTLLEILVIEGNLTLRKPYVNQKRTESGIHQNRTEPLNQRSGKDEYAFNPSNVL